jgi:hypothetical protein
MFPRGCDVTAALAPRITVNTVAPGLTATDRIKSERWHQQERARREAEIPLGRFGESAEIARMISFLAGPGGDYCTGQVFNINGDRDAMTDKIRKRESRQSNLPRTVSAPIVEPGEDLLSSCAF